MQQQHHFSIPTLVLSLFLHLCTILSNFQCFIYTIHTRKQWAKNTQLKMKYRFSFFFDQILLFGSYDNFKCPCKAHLRFAVCQTLVLLQQQQQINQILLSLMEKTAEKQKKIAQFIYQFTSVRCFLISISKRCNTVQYSYSREVC